MGWTKTRSHRIKLQLTPLNLITSGPGIFAQLQWNLVNTNTVNTNFRLTRTTDKANKF